jgi:DNA-binding response OmpR family regulator
MRVLLIEDDESLAAGVEEALRRHGFNVDVSRGGADAAAAVMNAQFDLALLDIGLPGADGLDLLDQLRRSGSRVPVMMITARDAVEDRVRGLRQGADDYLVKPFALDELIARCQALVRRGASARQARVDFGNLSLDLGTAEAAIDGRPLDLTSREWSLLQQLVLASPDVLSKAKLVESLGRWDREITSNAVEIYVSRLRAKLAGAHVEVRTVRGLGYRLVATAPIDVPPRDVPPPAGDDGTRR